MTPLDAKQSRPLEGGPSFGLGNRTARAIWWLVWLTLCRFTPPPLHGWRRMVLQLFGARIGKGARVHASARVWLPANLELGENVLIGPGVHLYNQGRILVGARSVVSQGAHLCASTHDISDPHFQLILRPIAVGEQCWIAAEAFIGPGILVGDRAVVGARAALFEDAVADGVYSGNPAQLIKLRKLRASD